MVSIDSIPAETPAQAPFLGIDFLKQVLEAIDDQPIVEALARHYTRGRPCYNQAAMLRAAFAKYVLSIRFTNRLIEQLNANPKLREL